MTALSPHSSPQTGQCDDRQLVILYLLVVRSRSALRQLLPAAAWASQVISPAPALLTFALLRRYEPQERARGVDSPRAAYFSALPQSFDTPLWFRCVQLRALGSTRVRPDSTACMPYEQD